MKKKQVLNTGKIGDEVMVQLKHLKGPANVYVVFVLHRNHSLIRPFNGPKAGTLTGW